MTRDVLIVLNPRRIDECLKAISELPIDKLWVRNYSEKDIQEAWGEIVAKLEGYESAFIVSDDAMPRPYALALLREALEHVPVVTGYSNLSSTDYRVNLASAPLREPMGIASYDLYSLKEVMEWPETLLPTYFAGFSLTGMATDLWRTYPYQVELGGWGGDFSLSKRLARADVPIFAHRDAFVWHVKEAWSQLDQEPRKRLLVGEEPRALELELWPPPSEA